MSEISRRRLLERIARSLTLTAAGVDLLTAQHAAHVHAMAAEEKGAYKPRLFNSHEYATLRRLAELIMPADENSASAVEAGAPEFIDLLASANEELARIYTGGLGWLDREMHRRFASDFVSAAPAQQTALLDLIAYRKNDSPELGPGVLFFTWVRNMTVDAYFTSPTGMKLLGYMGNGAMSSFSVPEEAIQYALKRSPV